MIELHLLVNLTAGPNVVKGEGPPIWINSAQILAVIPHDGHCKIVMARDVVYDIWEAYEGMFYIHKRYT